MTTISIDTNSISTNSISANSFSTIGINTIPIEAVPDRELLKRLVRVAENERHLTADLLILLGECDTRRLYLGEGCSSLFTYCTQVLHFSEHAAYHRIEAARAAQQFPIILELVANGSVTLTTVALLRPHLTPANHRELLTAAHHRTKREVEYQIACLAPKPDAEALIRRLPSYTPAQAAAAAKSVVSPPLAAAPQLHHDDSVTRVVAIAELNAPSDPVLDATSNPALDTTPISAHVARSTTTHIATATSAHVATPTSTPIATSTSAPIATSTSAPIAEKTAAPEFMGDELASAVPLQVTPPASAEPRPQVTPLASDRYLLRVTLSAETHAKLRRAQALMGHRVPDGDPHAIIGRALSLLVEHLERAKFAKVRRPRVGSDATSTSSSVSPNTVVSPSTTVSPDMSVLPRRSASPSAGGSRHVPAAMRRQVWSRDEGRCAFVGALGRCTETHRLEFHHVIPFARGGPTHVENLALRCRAHNAYESDLEFGTQIQRSNGRTTGTVLQETSPLNEARTDFAQESCSVRTEHDSCAADRFLRRPEPVFGPRQTT